MFTTITQNACIYMVNNFVLNLVTAFCNYPNYRYIVLFYKYIC